MKQNQCSGWMDLDPDGKKYRFFWLTFVFIFAVHVLDLGLNDCELVF